MESFGLLAIIVKILQALFGGFTDLFGGGSSYGVFTVLNSTAVTMNGDITSRTERHYDNLVEDYPNIDTIIMEDCPGSADDDTNLRVSLKIHQKGMHTHLRSSSIIESGAVDMFLAGTTRTMDSPKTAKIGVHSWSDNSGNEATDFPVGSSEHQQYVDYYVSVGFSLEDAKNFYYFTINKASAEDIYYMTMAEIEQYNVLTN